MESIEIKLASGGELCLHLNRFFSSIKKQSDFKMVCDLMDYSDVFHGSKCRTDVLSFLSQEIEIRETYKEDTPRFRAHTNRLLKYKEMVEKHMQNTQNKYHPKKLF